MNEPAPDLVTMLPHAIPACPNQRLLLFVMRRMASAGIDDAHATHALFIAFRQSFRRPLVLLRALMAEISRASRRSLLIAPCCAPRLTAAEQVLVRTVVEANTDPHRAHFRLTGLLGSDHCLGVLSSAKAVSQAFADLGKPLR